MTEGTRKLIHDPMWGLMEDVLYFAIRHKCVVDPDGCRSYLESYIRNGPCSCDKERLCCPCDQAPAELKRNAKCLCGLFWSSYEAY